MSGRPCYECGEAIGHVDGCSRARRNGSEQAALLERAHDPEHWAAKAAAERQQIAADRNGTPRAVAPVVGPSIPGRQPETITPKGSPCPTCGEPRNVTNNRCYNCTPAAVTGKQNFTRTKFCTGCNREVGRGLRHDRNCPNHKGSADKPTALVAPPAPKRDDPPPATRLASSLAALDFEPKPEPPPEPPRVVAASPTVMPRTLSELDAMRAIDDALAGLPTAAKRRALNWAAEVHGLELLFAPAKGAARND